MSGPEKLIRLNIIGRLKKDPRVDAYNIVGKVSGGTVNLTGTVKSYRALEFSAIDALNIEMVTYFENELVVNTA